ncbi:MAG TPA: NAD(P)H-dependent glycerol-3-phosphate dehydrogenase [Candidatus Sulfotelmatobacter sp.]
MSQIAIIGAGAWGTALSIVLGRKESHQVRLWAHDVAVCNSIQKERTNANFLPGCLIPERVTATNDLSEALTGARFVVGAMPSRHCRELFGQMRHLLSPGVMVVSATKGLEEGSLLRMSQVIADSLGSGKYHPRIGALSGPSFALETARGDPTAIAIASEDVELAQLVQLEFTDPRFRVYTNHDIIGVELGGALKNIVAIAAGICDGLGLGHNSVAALITRGLAEITRLAVACGARPETMAGLAGLGDLVLTCTGGLSRNRSVGLELGRGQKLPQILASMHGMVAEGVFTTIAAVGLAHARGVEVPITEQIHAILYLGKAPADAIADLMMRSGKSETHSNR